MATELVVGVVFAGAAASLLAVVFVVVLGLATATVLFVDGFGVVCALDAAAKSMTATKGRMIFFIIVFFYFFKISYC